MRFAIYGASATRAANIDWDAPVEVTPELLAAVAPHDTATMRTGVLRRGFSVDSVLHPKGSIAVTWFRGSEMLLELVSPDVPDELDADDGDGDGDADDDDELGELYSVETGDGGAR